MKKITCMLAVLALGWPAAQAQTPVKVDPTVLTNAPEFSSWTMVLTYADKQDDGGREAKYQATLAKMATENPGLAKALAKGSRAGFEPRRNTVSVVKTKEIKHETITFLSGPSLEIWSNPTSRVTRNSGTETLAYTAGSGSDEDFPELKWVTPGHFKEVRKIKGVDCLVFRGKVAKAQIESPLLLELTGTTPIPDTEAEVVVDAATHLPVSVQTDEVLRSYVFNPPPSEMQTFPPEFAAIMEKGEAQLRARLAPFSAP